MVSQERSFIPQLIQEIPDFKTWVQGYLKDSVEVLVGHTYMHLFPFFFVDSFGWLVTQYKLSPNDKMWSSKKSYAIQLWKSYDEGQSKLPSGVLKLVPFCPIWGNNVTKAMEK
jgi:hypothetical protein